MILFEGSIRNDDRDFRAPATLVESFSCQTSGRMLESVVREVGTVPNFSTPRELEV
jgi:hypothetical protein